MLLPITYASRWPTRLGLLAMLGLGLLAWHFYLERVAYSDLAYHVFENIQQRDFFVQNRRVAQIPTQVLPVLAIRWGLPMDWLLRLFSLSFVLYYSAVYAVSAYWLRNERAALLMPLALILIASRTFYWPQAELAQTMGALLLAHAGQSRQAPLLFGLGTLSIALAIVVGIFGHPLAIFIFLFLWAYDWLLHQRWRDWANYILLAVGIGTYFYRSATVPAGTYEDVGASFLANLRQFYPHYLSLASADEFWHLLRNNFITIPLVLIAYTVYCLAQRTGLALLRLLLVWVAVAVFTVIVLVWSPVVGDPTYYENLLLPLGLFVGAPLAWELLPALERWPGLPGPALAGGLLALLLAGRLSAVYRMHDTFTAYQHWLTRVLAYVRPFPEHRFILDDVNADPTRLRAGWPWWASAYETLLLSTRFSPDSAQSVYVSNELPRYATQLRDKVPGQFLAAFDHMPSWELSARYFRIPDPNQPYRLLNTPPPADTASLASYIAARRATKLELVEFAKPLAADHRCTVRIRFSPPAGAQPLHSGLRTEHPTLIQTRFVDPTGWPDANLPVEVPLEVDVWHPWAQELPLNCPAKPGLYVLEIRLRSKDYRNWPVQLRLPVEIH